MLGENEAVSHQRVDRAERRVGDVDVIYLHVAICDPCLAVVRVGADLLPVGVLTPCSVGDLVPERRSPCAYGSVEEDVLLEVIADVLLHTDDALCVLVAGIARVGTNGCTLS